MDKPARLLFKTLKELEEEEKQREGRKKSPKLGQTLDGRTGYYINGQVQTPDGQNHQGYEHN